MAIPPIFQKKRCKALGRKILGLTSAADAFDSAFAVLKWFSEKPVQRSDAQASLYIRYICIDLTITSYSDVFHEHMHSVNPKILVAPENGWLEDCVPFGKAYFLGLYSLVLERVG